MVYDAYGGSSLRKCVDRSEADRVLEVRKILAIITLVLSVGLILNEIVKGMKRILPMAVLMSLACFTSSYSVAPRLFFSDLTDGPISGWEQSDSVGAAVTVWGLNFDTTRGTSYITCGGTDLTADGNYAEWGAHNAPTGDSADFYSSARGLERITFWLDTTMTAGAGSISVTTSEGTSDWIPFYCRELGSSHIYFISRDGSDSDSGFYADTAGHGDEGPWLLASKVKDMQRGDIAYFRSDGVWNEEDAWDAVVFFGVGNHQNGVQDTCMAMLSYPGEIAQLGDSSQKYTIRHGLNDTLNYWTFSKFKMRSWGFCTRWNLDATVGGDDHVRFIGNDFSTYAGGYSCAKFRGGGEGQRYLYFYGNNCHDARSSNRGDAADPASRAYALYIQGTGTHDYLYIGWNEFGYCDEGAVQIFGHTTADWADHIYLHDNLFIRLGNAAGRLGGGDGGSLYEFIKHLYFYNNIIIDCRYKAGGGTALRIGSDTWGAHKGRYYLWNNTFYDNPRPIVGFQKQPTADQPYTIELKNNILYANTGLAYFDVDVSDTVFIASNNCYYNGTGGIPSWDSTGSFETDPLMVNPASYNFTLQDTSPCIDSASTISLTTPDYNGIARPQGSAYDIGAYEYAQANPDESSPDPPDFFNVVSVSSYPDSSKFMWGGVDSTDLDSVWIRKSGVSCPSSKTDGDSVYYYHPDQGSDTLVLKVTVTKPDTIRYSIFVADSSGNWNATVVCDTTYYITRRWLLFKK